LTFNPDCRREVVVVRAFGTVCNVCVVIEVGAGVAGIDGMGAAKCRADASAHFCCLDLFILGGDDFLILGLGCLRVYVCAWLGLTGIEEREERGRTLYG